MNGIKEELFKGITFSDLMSDVYHNSKKVSRQINQLISQLHPLIKTTSDATIVVPLIKEYLDISVKNDDHLVKLTAIVQRFISTKQTIAGEGSLLSEDEKKQLLAVANETFEDELTEEVVRLEAESKELKQTILSSREKIDVQKSAD